MGLDMYLSLKRQELVSRYDDDYEQKKAELYPEELKGFTEDVAERSCLCRETSYQIGYWRKENAIHNWFVQNCANGADDCRATYVSVSKAKELLGLCKQVLADHGLAKELLPTTDGFFFGSTEYDEWYFDGLEYTAVLLEKAIDFIEEQEKKHVYWSLIYEASW